MIGNRLVSRTTSPNLGEIDTSSLDSPHPRPYPTLRTHREQGGERPLTPLQFGQWRGQGRAGWSTSNTASQLQEQGSIPTAPHCNVKLQAAHSLGLLGLSSYPLHRRNSHYVVPLSSSWRNCSAPTSLKGVQQGLVAQGIHSCGKAGSWGFTLHTQSPQWQWWGKPLTRTRVEVLLP